MHCSGADFDVVDAQGQLATRACVQLLRFEPVQGRLRAGQSFNLEVAAFASGARFCATREEFEAAQVAEGWKGGEKGLPGVGDTSFFAVGMFGPPPKVGDRAQAVFAGKVLRAQRLRNRLNGAESGAAKVSSFPGPIDAAFEIDSAQGEAKAGSTRFAAAWLVGRPALV